MSVAPELMLHHLPPCGNAVWHWFEEQPAVVWQALEPLLIIHLWLFVCLCCQVCRECVERKIILRHKCKDVFKTQEGKNSFNGWLMGRSKNGESVLKQCNLKLVFLLTWTNVNKVSPSVMQKHLTEWNPPFIQVKKTDYTFFFHFCFLVAPLCKDIKRYVITFVIT